MQEFINLCKGSMILKEYAQKCTQLCMYAPSMVVNSRTKMNKCLIVIFDMVVKECHTTIIIGDMNIYCLMVHAQQI